MGTLLIILAVIFIVAPIASAYAKRLERPLPDGNVIGELARLREEVDRLSAQVNRLEEEQGFMVQLLSEEQRPLLPPRRPDQAGDGPERETPEH
jgi:hypothetical protein